MSFISFHIILCHDICFECIKLHYFWRQECQRSKGPWGWSVCLCVSDVGVLGQFGGAEGEARVGRRRYVRVRREQGFEGGRRVECGRGQQAWVDAHADALRHQTVGGLQHGPWGGQEVGDGGGRRVGEQGGRGWRRSLDRVGGAGMREGVAVHCGRDEGLRTARLGVVSVPLVVTGAVVLDLRGTGRKKEKHRKRVKPLVKPE